MRDVPRKGNVDRNRIWLVFRVWFIPTFPARGTWIEIVRWVYSPPDVRDVPRKGNVDRN